MIDKIAHVPEVDEYGFTRVVPFGARGAGLEKVASLPDGVQRYIDRYFTPKDGKLGLLVTALGAGEYWGSNSNADLFDEKSLNHVPSGWSDDPALDKPLAQGWGWGFPTFYRAHPFSHHANRDPKNAIGSIEFVIWDPDMHWVLAVMEIDEQKAKRNNGTWILERAAAGKSISISMGCRVPFDVISTSTDMARYMRAWDQYDPKKHKSPAEAILAEHARKPIHGLSKTRKEYLDDLLFHANEVLPSGVKIYAINDFPSFFDLSGVGVPADQVAWAIRKLGGMSRCKIAGVKCAGGCTGDCTQLTAPSAVLWEECMSKSAEVRTASLGKGADIDKTVPALDAKIEKPNPTDIPKDLLNRLGKDHDLGSVLATPSLMGMPLRPKEFRRIMMIRIGKKDLADKLDEKDVDMPRSLDEECPFDMGPGMFDDSIARMLLPLLGRRSALGPVVKRINITVIRVSPDSEPKGDEPDLQKKISSLYNGYRRLVMDKIGACKEVMAARPWLRGALYGLHSLDKVGGLTVPLVPLVVNETLDHLRDW